MAEVLLVMTLARMHPRAACNGDSDCSARLNRDLHALPHEAHVQHNVRFTHQHNLIDEIAHHRKGERSKRCAQSVGDGDGFHRRLNRTFALARRSVAREFWFSTDDLDRRLERFGSDRNA